MSSLPSFSQSAPPSADRGPKDQAAFRDKLDMDRIAALRKLVEGTGWSYRRIGQELGVSASTVSRYATQAGWKRPAGQAQPPSDHSQMPQPAQTEPAGVPAGRHRSRILEKLWQLAERHAEELEGQPIAVAQHYLQPLARLTRVLGEIEKHTRAALEDPYPEPQKPRRTIHELRDELVAHLERIQREEGYGWEVREWWFQGGGGI